RLRLSADGGRGVLGAAWRSSQSAADVRPFVAWINADEFLTTDGGRGVTHWVWPQGKEAVSLPAERDDKAAPPVEVPARIVPAPAVLPRADGKGELRVCVADADGGVTLLAGDLLQPRQRWDLGGRITAGPFVRGNGVGCVVDGRRLVWLDSEKKD